MSWSRAMMSWLFIIFAESLHGTVRQLYLAPRMGDLPARQLGVFLGSAIVFAVACVSIRWIGARTARDQLSVGTAWVLLTITFEIGLGMILGYTRERMVADYDVARGGFMAAGLLFMLMAPWLAARVRGVRAEPQRL